MSFSRVHFKSIFIRINNNAFPVNRCFYFSAEKSAQGFNHTSELTTQGINIAAQERIATMSGNEVRHIRPFFIGGLIIRIITKPHYG